MKQQKNKRKNNRTSRAPKPTARGREPPTRAVDQSASESCDRQRRQQQREEQEEERQLDVTKSLYALMEAFDSVSIEVASSALKDADGDINKAAEILANLPDCVDDPSTSSGSTGTLGFDSIWGNGSTSCSSSNSSGSCTDSLNGFVDGRFVNRKGFRGGNKQKKVLAVTGTVSTVLGKEYVKRASLRRAPVKDKELSSEEAEQLLCSMLGNDCELSVDVVRDVLCHCGYDIEQAFDVLLDLSSTSGQQSKNSGRLNGSINYKEDSGFQTEHGDRLVDGASDCTSLSSETELHDSASACDCRDYLQAVTSWRTPSQTSRKMNESHIPQEVLESLFNTPKSFEHEPNTMNWRKVVKKMQSLGPKVDSLSSWDPGVAQDPCGKTSEYHLFRRSAGELWESRNSYYQKAAAAHSKGERGYAAYLSDQGRRQTKLAQEADERASYDIFKARNKGIENVVTIDMHGQHVKQAMRLLKLHLLFGTYVHSIQALRVITGCGSHGLGKSKLKQSVTQLLEKEGIDWKEENQGVLLIKLNGGHKQYSFLDAESDSD